MWIRIKVSVDIPVLTAVRCVVYQSIPAALQGDAVYHFAESKTGIEANTKISKVMEMKSLNLLRGCLLIEALSLCCKTKQTLSCNLKKI